MNADQGSRRGLLRLLLESLLVALLLFVGLLGWVRPGSRERIRIVGSSTVYPFSTAVAEEFGATTRFRAATVESTGSGGGHKLFGAGVGLETPDITCSSRRMKVSEFERARANGVGRITEAVIGYDGIAIAQNGSVDPMGLSLRELTLAVLAEVPDPLGSGRLVPNPYRFWDDIDAGLPHRAIKIYGPPTTSGTRDAFHSLCLGPTSRRLAAYRGEYGKVRQDGRWVDSGEHDDVMVRKLAEDSQAVGIIGFSFLNANRDRLRGAAINGVLPTVATISSGQYPLSRSLYFYVKTDHMRSVPGLFDYVELFMDEAMIGDDGHLADLGLVPLPGPLREASRQRVLSLEPMSLRDGQFEALAVEL